MQTQWRMNKLMVPSALTFVRPKNHGLAYIATSGRSDVTHGKWGFLVRDANGVIKLVLVSWLMLLIDGYPGTLKHSDAYPQLHH